MHYPVLEILPAAVHERLIRGQQPWLVDVRSALEFKRGHAKGSVSIPVDCLTRKEVLRKLGVTAGTRHPLYLISGQGERARQAAGKLREQGLQQLYLVRGGTSAWAEDFPLV